jgi:N-acetylmuramoyl-L-alanine amidase
MATLLLIACLLPLGPSALAQGGEGVAVFAAEHEGASRSLRTATRTVSDLAYADLQGLAEGLGAGFVITASRVQVDLDGASAWVYFNDDRVTASLAEFTLAHPVIQRDGRAWLALRDVPPFFQQAFQLALTPQAAESPEDPELLVDFDAQLIDEQPIDEQSIDDQLIDEPDSPREADEPALDPLQDLSPDAIRDLRTARGPERVVIDPAHGGEDTGVIGPAGLVEKDVVLGVAKALRERLSGRIGREVLLTREDDRALDVTQRAARSNDPANTLFISVHCGGALSQEAAGVAVFYLPDVVDESMRQLAPAQRQEALERRTANATVSRRLAERVAQTLSDRTGAPSRGVRGVPSRLLMAVDSPGILVEIGCLTSPAEEERMGGAGYQEEVAQAMAEAILAHYGLDTQGAAR